MNYYLINYDGKAITIGEKMYLKRINANNDIIVWYDDGVNIFVGDCCLSKSDVKKAITDRIGEYKEQFECFH
jgi:hypothetical protein